uniref:Uncharacterized protein n=1 Tax=Junco hyemalis TaxID=40217 RepID=A0A8C5JPL7_JUNHY
MQLRECQDPGHPSGCPEQPRPCQGVADLAEVVYVLDGSAEGSHHLLAMATDLVRARGQVEVGEVGLGWGVGVEHPGRVGQSVVLTPAGPTSILWCLSVLDSFNSSQPNMCS